MTDRRSLLQAIVPCVVALACASIVPGASAFWSGSSADDDGVGAAAATRIMRGAAPSVAAQGIGSVQVSWGPARTEAGRTVERYLVARRDETVGEWVPAAAGCAGVVTTTSCLETGLPVGRWSYRVTPVLGTDWRGPSGTPSGSVSAGPQLMTLDEPVLGAPLRPAVSGGLSGFEAGEDVSFSIDGEPLPGGAPTVVDESGNATFALELPVDIADGSYTVEARGAGAGHSSATTSLLVDTIRPTLTSRVSPAPNAAGWNTTTVRLAGIVTDGDGSGGAGTWYTIDGSDPRSSPTARQEVGELEVATSRTVRIYTVDVAGNGSAVVDVPVRIDRVPPQVEISIAEGANGASADPAHDTIYYRGVAGGAFRLLVAADDAGGSGAAVFSSSGEQVSSIGFSHVAGTVTAPVGGPYVDNVMSWSAGTTSSPVPVVSVADVAGNVTTVEGRVVPDDAGPIGGFVQVTGVPEHGAAYASTTSLRVDMVDATDDGSGLLAGGRRLMRAEAPLTAVNGRVACGSYGTETQVYGGADASFDDVVPSGAACYRYVMEVTDNVGNVARFASDELRVQAGPSTSLTPRDVSVTPLTGARHQWVSGATVYYDPTYAGSFVVEARASDDVSGARSMTFPSMVGFSGGGAVLTPLAGDRWRVTYAWSRDGAAVEPGTQSVTATNGAGQTSSTASAFAVRADATAPTGVAVSVTGLGGTDGRYATTRHLQLELAPGTDAGSGFDVDATRLARASAPLLSNGSSSGSCGAFGAFVSIAEGATLAAEDDVPVDGTCYRYRYAVVDRVGNEAVSVSAEVRVHSVAPTPVLEVGDLVGASWSAADSTIYFRPSAPAGSFTMTVRAADLTSGIASIALPTPPSGWEVVSPSVASRTYSWSAPDPPAWLGGEVSATSHAGLTGTANFALTPDMAPPTGGSVTYASEPGSNGDVSVVVATGDDAASGVALGSGRLLRRAAHLTSGSCSAFGDRVVIASSAGAGATVVDTSVLPGWCYRYEFDVADRVGNTVTYLGDETVTVAIS
ncbi:MAG: Large repetitive protein [Thermoleophilia bacterium]|nr:Large repetitive protein [Thermoleophilia bacterium]